MKQLLLTLSLFLSFSGFSSTLKVIPEDTIITRSGKQILGTIKTVGSTTIVYEAAKNGKNVQIKKNKIDRVVYDDGRTTYYNSEDHENEPSVKNKSRLFKGKNGAINVVYAILGIIAALLVFGGIWGLISFLNSWG